MSEPKGKPCAECDQVAAWKVKASAVGQAGSRLLSRGSSRGYEADVSPLEQVAADWSVSADAFLRRGITQHRRCVTCSILMGPGHLESGSGPSCGTCRTRNANDNVGPPVIGRRGWDGVQGTRRAS
jgi:hypothetical protein